MHYSVFLDVCGVMRSTFPLHQLQIRVGFKNRKEVKEGVITISSLFSDSHRSTQHYCNQ